MNGSTIRKFLKGFDISVLVKYPIAKKLVTLKEYENGQYSRFLSHFS